MMIFEGRTWFSNLSRMVLLAVGMALLAGCWNEKVDSNTLLYRVNHIAVDPHQAGHVLVATDGGGIFKSTDGGATWHVTLGLTDFFVNWIEYDRIDPSKLFGAPRWIYAGTENGGLFLSTDRGETWVTYGDGIASQTINGIVVDTLTCAETACFDIYVGTGDAGVYVSRNRGIPGFWASMNTGLNSMEISRLALNGDTRPSLLLAGTNNGELYSSRPTGVNNPTWTKAPTNPSPHPEEIYTIQILDLNNYFVGVSGFPTERGIFKTANGGTAWNPVAVGDNDVRVIVADLTNPSAPIYYSDALGVSKSTDIPGAFWTPISAGLTDDTKDITWIAIDRNDPATPDLLEPDQKVLYASTFRRKLLKYSNLDDGAGWRWRELQLTP